MKAADIMDLRTGDEVILAWLSMTGPGGRTVPTAKMAHAVVTGVTDQGQVMCRSASKASLPNDLWTIESVHRDVRAAREYLLAKVHSFIRSWDAVIEKLNSLEPRP